MLVIKEVVKVSLEMSPEDLEKLTKEVEQILTDAKDTPYQETSFESYLFTKPLFTQFIKSLGQSQDELPF